MPIWLWLILAAWAGFCAGILFIAGWANAHKPYDTSAFAEWYTATYDQPRPL